MERGVHDGGFDARRSANLTAFISRALALALVVKSALPMTPLRKAVAFLNMGMEAEQVLWTLKASGLDETTARNILSVALRRVHADQQA